MLIISKEIEKKANEIIARADAEIKHCELWNTKTRNSIVSKRASELRLEYFPKFKRYGITLLGKYLRNKIG